MVWDKVSRSKPVNEKLPVGDRIEDEVLQERQTCLLFLHNAGVKRHISCTPLFVSSHEKCHFMS
jgi:hypothetical protein